MDWPSFAAGAVAAAFAITLARVVRGIQAAEAPDVAEAEAPPAASQPTAATAVPATPAPAMFVERPATAPLAFLEGLPVEVVAGRLMREHPYVAAYAIHHINPGFADMVLSLMSPHQQEEIIHVLTRDEPLKLSGEAFVGLIGRLKADG